MITVDSNLDDVKQLPEMRELAPYFQGRCDSEEKVEEGKTPAQVQAEKRTWQADSMVYGLTRLQEFGKKGIQRVFKVYSQEQITEDPDLQDVVVVRFPGKDPNKPFILMCAGGGYTSVCSMGEAWATAASFNDLGYTVFCLNYRTRKNDQEILFPKPLDDLAQAVRYITTHGSELGIENMHYALCGFSAGGNLIEEFGLPTVGYKHYGLPGPDVMFPIYACYSPLELEGQLSDFLKQIMFSESTDDAELEPYNITKNADLEYPPCYIVAARDDDMVPYTQSVNMASRLQELGIPHHLELAEHGGHGFGNGYNTELDGWPKRAIEFWKTLTGQDD